MALQAVDRVVNLSDLALIAAMVGGAVGGATAGWMSKRNGILAVCAAMVGIIGGLWLGSLMGNVFPDPTRAKGMLTAHFHSLPKALLAGLVGVLPAAFLVGGTITFLSLRHVRNRPPPYRTGFKAFGYGVAAGLAAAAAWLLV